MKQLLISLLMLSAIFSVQGQQIRKSDKDSSIKYYLAFFEHPSIEAIDKFDKWRNICLKQCHTKADSTLFMNDMVEAMLKKQRRP